jgi:hypothetical protein
VLGQYLTLNLVRLVDIAVLKEASLVVTLPTASAEAVVGVLFAVSGEPLEN